MVKTSLLCSGGIALLSLALIAGTQPNAVIGKNQKTHKEAVETPTSIDATGMSAVQKHHSTLFRGYEGVSQGGKLRDMSANRDVTVSVDIGDAAVRAGFDLHSYLSELTCSSDAVVIGQVTSKASQITEEGTFLFTDYTIVIERVLKTNKSVPVNASETITVTRAGGSVRYNNHIIRALDARQKLLKPARKYLLFLTYIPQTGAYRAVQHSGDNSFLFIGDQLIQVSDSPEPLGPRHAVAAASFINDITDPSATHKCAKQGGTQ